MKLRPTTHCKRGHELTGDNLYLRANGTRYCRACQYELDGRDIRAIRVRQAQGTKTHCARGHELTLDNIRLDRDGSRRCKTCKRIARSENATEEQRVAKARKRAEYFKRNYTTGKMVGTIRAADITASRPSEELIAEARRRAAATPRDLTGMFFNDPPKGYSALDRKMSGAVHG